MLTGGAEKARDLPIEGRDLRGVHFAMDYLPQQNRRVSREPQNGAEPILADGKYVVVIGGGDTGSDCIGTAFRQGAVSVTQLEIMPMPPAQGGQAADLAELAAEAAHLVQPGGRRRARFLGADDAVLRPRRAREAAALRARRRQASSRSPAREFELKADLVLLAMGFVSPVHEGMIAELGLELDPRGNVKANDRGLPDLQSEGLRRRRHAPRPVARRLGDPRGPPGGARGGQVS